MNSIHYIRKQCTEDENRPQQRKTTPEIVQFQETMPAISSVLVPCFSILGGLEIPKEV
jgi:hypothetical protein